MLLTICMKSMEVTTLLAAYKREMKDWTHIKIGDIEGFCRFCSFLLKFQSALCVNKWNGLD